jgi:hypothetical protein
MHLVLALGLLVVSLVLVVHVVLGVSTTIARVSELVVRLLLLVGGVSHMAPWLLARVRARILGGVGVRLIASVVWVLELVWLHLFLTCKVSWCVRYSRV